jgi:hypothetical protein
MHDDELVTLGDHEVGAIGSVNAEAECREDGSQ